MAALLLVVLMTGGASTGFGQSVDESEGSLRDEDLPLNIRLSILTQYLVHLAQDAPERGVVIVSRAGLEVDSASFAVLGDYYGDYDRRMNDRRKREIAGLESQPERRSEIMDGIVADWAAYTGGVLGRWLRHLDQEGHDGRSFLRRLVADEHRSIAHGSSGGMGLDDLNRRAERFGEEFENEYGVTTAAIIAATEENK